MDKLQKKIQILLNLYKSKKLIEAENFAQNLINENPNVVFLYNVLGLILTDQKKTGTTQQRKGSQIYKRKNLENHT